MNNLITKFAAVLLLSISFSVHSKTISYERVQEPKTEADIKPFAELSIHALNDISSEWSIASLKRNIDPLGIDGNEDVYQKLLDRVSSLGKFKICEGLQFGEIEKLDVEGAKAISGKCEFENGPAKVTLVFMKFKGKLKIMSFLVNKVE